MDAEKDFAIGLAKVSPAFAIAGMSPAEWAAVLAAIYSLCLILDFIWKKIKEIRGLRTP